MADANVDSVQQSQDAQNLDNLTSLQQADSTTAPQPTGGTADATVTTTNPPAPDTPSLYNDAVGTNNNQTNLEAAGTNSLFDTTTFTNDGGATSTTDTATTSGTGAFGTEVNTGNSPVQYTVTNESPAVQGAGTNGTQNTVGGVQGGAVVAAAITEGSAATTSAANTTTATTDAPIINTTPAPTLNADGAPVTGPAVDPLLTDPTPQEPTVVLPVFAITGPVVIDEAAGTASYTITLSNPSDFAASVQYGTSVDGVLTAEGEDITATSGTITYTPGGQTSWTVNVPITNDATYEGSETYSIDLSAATGATISATAGSVTTAIVDNGSLVNDDRPVFAITGPVVIDEAAGTASYTITLSNPSDFAASVQYGTSVDGVLTAEGEDITATSGTITYTPGGQTSWTVNVPITNDATYEGSETYSIDLSAATGATISATAGSVTTAIVDNGSLVNDDRPVFAITGPVVIDEAAGTASYTITLSNPSDFAASVQYGTSVDGVLTAEGEDITATSGTITYTPGGQTSWTVNVPITNDATYEGSETYSIDLSAATGATISATAGSVTTAIVDNGSLVNDDRPVFAITGPVVIDEAAGTASYTITLSNPSDFAASVQYGTSVDGVLTAEGEDITATSGTITYTPGGQTSWTVNVPITNDATYEGSETYSIDLSAATGATISATAGSVTTAIVDNGSLVNDDRPVFAITGPVVIDEAAGTASYTITLSNPSDFAASVQYGTSVDGVLTAEGEDITATSGTITYTPGGQTSWTVNVPITNDATYEGSETYSIDLSAATGATISATAGSVTTAIVDNGSLVNDDRPVFAITGPVVIDEAAGTASYTITLSNPSDFAASVQYGTSVDGVLTAEGEDITATSGTITYTPGGQTSWTVNVPITNDATYEGSETYSIDLSAATGATISATAGSVTTAIVDNGSLVNDDRPVFAITGPVVIDEAAGTASYTITLSNPSDFAASVQYGTSVDGVLTAEGEDITATSGTITYTPGGQTSWTVNVPITNDATYEGSETYSIDLSAATGATISATAGSVTTAIVDNGSLVNDDRPVFAITGPVVIDEAAGTASYTITLSNPSDFAASVQYGTSVDGVLTAEGEDITATSGTITYTPGGQTSWTVNVPITNDATYEGSETYSIDLSAATGATISATAGSVTTAIVDNGSLVNDDRPVFAITGPVVIDEAAGTASYTITLSNPSDFAASVQYGTSVDGVLTAEGEDITATSGTITYTPGGQTSWTVNVPITNDATYEGSETYSIDLSAATGATISATAGSVTTAIVDNGSLVNDDRPVFAITGPVVIDEAAGTASYTITLSNPSDFAASVQYGTSVDGVLTAEGEDITATSGTITYTPGGQTSWTVNVPITNDATYEGSETYSIDLSAATGATISATAGSVTTAIVDNGSLVNDDRPVFAITGPVVIDEAAGTASYTITLSNPSDFAASVQYGTSVDGVLTAEGEDITATSGTITYTPGGQTSWTVNVPITNDATYEGSETYSIDLSAATGATISATAGSVTTAIVDNGSLVNDDRPVFAITGPVVIDEAAGTASYTITLSNPSDFAASVQYGTSVDGVLTAEGEDITATSGTITYTPGGQTSWTVNVPITNDATYEGSETYSIDLSAATGATISATAGSVTTAIVDESDLNLNSKPVISSVAQIDNSILLITDDTETLSGKSDGGYSTQAASGSALSNAMLNSVNVDFGSDGVGATKTIGGFSLTVTSLDGISSLKSGGSDIVLSKSVNDVVGKVGSTEIFKISVTDGGIVTINQYRPIDHIGTIGSTKEILYLADGKVTLTATVTAVDGNGDSIRQAVSVDLGGNIGFEDDGPSINISSQLLKISTPQTYIGTWQSSLGADVFSAASISQLVESVVLNKALINGVYISPSTPMLAGSINGTSRVFKGSFDYDSNGALSGGVKTANFTMNFAVDGKYTLTIDNAKQLVVLSDTQYTAATKSSGPIPIYNLSYTDTTNASQIVTATVSSQITGSTPINYALGVGAPNLAVSSTYIGTDVNVSADGIGVDNNVLSSYYAKSTGVAKSEMITFDPAGEANKITMNIKGTGSVGWGTGGANDVLYITVYGDANKTYSFYLTNITGVSTLGGVDVLNLASGATSFAISKATPGLTTGLSTFNFIEKIDVITGFTADSKGDISSTDVKITFGFETTLSSVIDVPVVMDFTAKIVDADGDIAYSNFVDGSTASALSGDGELLGSIYTLAGTSSAEGISGGIGKDTIIGGSGADILAGGSGQDIFKYTAITDLTNSSSGAVEKIIDFSSVVDQDKLDFGNLLNSLSSAALKNTVMIDSTDGASSHSILNISLSGTTYELDINNINPNFSISGGKYVELDSQVLLGNSGATKNSGSWTDIVDIKSSTGFLGDTDTNPISGDGWTLKILDAGVSHTTDGNNVLFTKNGTLTTDVHVEITTSDGVIHDVSNIDKIQWHG